MTRRRPLPVLVWVLALLAAACSGDKPAAAPATAPVPEASSTVPSTTSTTARPTTTSTTLKPTTTTTTMLGLGPGEAFIGGTVSGPSGPIDGATVRVERVVGKLVASMDVATSGGGSWQLASVLGGSYRVRASKLPEFGQSTTEAFFLAAADRKTIDLRLPVAGADRITATVTPTPPRVDQLATVTIQYGSTRFDDQGRPAINPKPNVALTLTLGPGINLESPAQSLTDGNGNSNWRIRCTAEGAKTATLTIGTGTTPVNLPACASAPAPATTTTRRP